VTAAFGWNAAGPVVLLAALATQFVIDGVKASFA